VFQRCPTCGGLLAADKPSLLAPDERLTPWMIHDLPRIACIVEYREAELTDEERQMRYHLKKEQCSAIGLRSN